MFHLDGTNGSIYIKYSKFKDGQPHIKIPHVTILPTNDIAIVGRITSSDDLVSLMLIVDVLKYNLRGKDLHLRLSYLMGGRMDRQISCTEPVTLKVICDTINSIGFKSICLYDCHSVASQALLGAVNYLPESYVLYMLGSIEKPVVVIPDAGATHRVMEMIDSYPIIQALKTRNPNTQELSDFKIVGGEEYINNRNCVIIDDICDGGRTFSNIGKILKDKGAQSIHLFVTHGIFSYGFDIPNIDYIYTTNSYRDVSEYPKGITIYQCPYAPIPEPSDLNFKNN